MINGSGQLNDMKKVFSIIISLGLLFSGLLTIPLRAEPASVTMFYGDVSLSGGFQSGHFLEEWDLTACDLVIKFTYDRARARTIISPLLPLIS